MASYGIGANLVSAGQEQLGEATKLLKESADQESARNAQNKINEANQKAGRQQLGGTVGALAGAAIGAEYGSVGGPMGSLIGGAIGAVAAGLF